ncbi:MAG: CDP-glycerol glycerophosphotransferase family protein [Lachnospiraceae bacterium]|nr:CDP-glycerol glycerophosphotransferase family protein [Lachnospiraceae bacterium]
MKRVIKKVLRKLALMGYALMVRVLPLSKDVVVFESNVGRNYSGNARAIYEYMIQQGMDGKYRLVWSVEDTSTNIPGRVIKVRRTRMKYLYYMAIARVWVSDSRMPKWLVKREGNTYIQTWHGTPLKKLALDMDVMSMGGSTDVQKYHDNFVANTRTWDYLISQNAFSTEVFRRCFAFDKDMLEIGYPRNDVLFHSNTPQEKEALKKKLGLPLDKKIILYAPTWRDDQYYQKSIYKFVSDMDYGQMQNRLGDEYAMIVKFHYLVKDHIDWSQYGDFIYEFNEHQDIAELYLVSDILITDYSSVMFDYSLLKRPMFFFAYDLENYKNNLRGFYFDFLATAPGPIVETTEELIDSIVNYDAEEWKEKYDAFSKRYNHADDGGASEKVCRLIEEKLAQSNK